MFRYNLKMEKGIYLPTFSDPSFFQYFWLKYLNFKLKIFNILVFIASFSSLLTLFLYYFYFENEWIDYIWMFSTLFGILIFLNIIFMILNFSKNQTKHIRSKFRAFFASLFAIYNSIILILVWNIFITINNASKMEIVWFLMLWFFGFFEFIVLVLYILVVVAKIKICYFSFTIPQNITIAFAEDSELNSFDCIYEDNDVWDKDEIIFEGQNLTIKYYGIGFAKKFYRWSCYYIFQINNELFCVDFCFSSKILITKENKKQLEEKLISYFVL